MLKDKRQSISAHPLSAATDRIICCLYFNDGKPRPLLCFFLYLSGAVRLFRCGFIGVLWALGVIAEIGDFLVDANIACALQCQTITANHFCINLFALAINGLCRSTYPEYLVFAQLLHGFSYAMHHAVSIHLVYQLFGQHHQGRGQALYGSLTFGIGGIIGSVSAGYLWQNTNPVSTYIWAAGLSFVAGLVIWKRLH